MLVVTRYRVTLEDAAGFRRDAAAALGALTACPGCTSGTVGRAVDDPQLWTLTTTWESVGSYRRALSAYDVKLLAVPVMYRAIDEATAFEPLTTWTPDAGLAEHVPSLAPDAAETGPGQDPVPDRVRQDPVQRDAADRDGHDAACTTHESSSG